MFISDINPLKNKKIISSLGVGEKVLLASNSAHLIFLSSNFVSAGKLKRGLEAFGKKVEIVSNARENDDEHDKNLLPFVQSLNRYLAGQIDALIFLPCSAIVKFDSKKIEAFRLEKGQTINLDQVLSKLVSFGYERTSLVEMGGQFALRGDILDIFSTNSDKPIRIELFDDLIENISIFDQISMKNLEKIEFFDIFASFLPLGEDCAFDLEGDKILDEPKKVNDEIELLIKSYQVSSIYKKENFIPFDYLLKKADFIFDNYQILKPEYVNQMLPTRSYLTDYMALKYDIIDFKNLNQAVILFAGEERYKLNLQNFLLEQKLSYKDFDDEEEDELESGVIYLSSKQMPYSFSFLKEGIVGIGSDSLFRKSITTFSKNKHNAFYLPKVGEYVVHTFHGVGKCIRIERMKISDIEKDYFVIEYKKGDILYLPSEEANTISAYVGSEISPKLSSLGGGEFLRLVERVKSSIKEMAISLVDLYNEREKLKGFKFKRDDFLEKQFADAFAYGETPDQLRAIADIDKDMESDKVMDRLVCGDVGFGKTEVALRGAFKCVYNGRQVALLCPTTILSEQHYRSAKERLEPFGVRVAVINRFRTPLQVKDILRRVKDGEIDVLIGTHRLLSDDVIYKDLGLLIFDEEQRFGVEHKEKIKDKFRNIDVITLSATPIPRTLNMSLSGIRDISIIETPPRDRLPIQTYLAEESEQLYKDVILREMARGGQSFVVYNRVESIEEFAAYLRRLLPEAKIGVAHGQMPEKMLENIIARLYNNEFNILIATTLIENGINLPLANTMIIVDADRLGLSQLYQLRGRIGRSDKLSYAYLTYTKDKVINEEAAKRLETMKEFSQLGSGFKIAMRDLEIRGAGNIFGKEQHGHIEKVGYDMYVKLLNEQVQEIKGETVKKQSDVKLEISLSAYISEDYIEDGDQRVVYYTRIGDIQSREELDELMVSLEDGFGAVPQEIKNLALFAYLRNLAGQYKVKRIVINKLENVIYLEKEEKIIEENLAANLDKFRARLSFDNNIKIKFDWVGSVQERLEKVIEFFECAQLS